MQTWSSGLPGGIARSGGVREGGKWESKEARGGGSESWEGVNDIGWERARGGVYGGERYGRWRASDRADTKVRWGLAQSLLAKAEPEKNTGNTLVSACGKQL